MNLVIANRWVDALLSGKYEQTGGVLRNEKGFCCLGVLCDLYAQDHPEARWDDTARVQRFCVTPEHYGADNMLPDTVRAWADMCSGNGDIVYEDMHEILNGYGLRGNTLAGANDHGAKFEQLAQVIKDHADKL